MDIPSAREIARKADPFAAQPLPGLAEAAKVLDGALVVVEEACRTMNAGTPGWMLRDRIFARIGLAPMEVPQR